MTMLIEVELARDQAQFFCASTGKSLDQLRDRLIDVLSRNLPSVEAGVALNIWHEHWVVGGLFESPAYSPNGDLVLGPGVAHSQAMQWDEAAEPFRFDFAIEGGGRWLLQLTMLTRMPLKQR